MVSAFIMCFSTFNKPPEIVENESTLTDFVMESSSEGCQEVIMTDTLRHVTSDDIIFYTKICSLLPGVIGK